MQLRCIFATAPTICGATIRMLRILIVCYIMGCAHYVKQLNLQHLEAICSCAAYLLVHRAFALYLLGKYLLQMQMLVRLLCNNIAAQYLLAQ